MDNTLVATIILGVIGIIVTGYYSRHTKKLAHEQLLKQLFTEFNGRYDKLNNYMSLIEKQYPTIELLSEAKDADILKQKVIDYFSLCAEEFFWYYHKKRIDTVIWKSWQSGMNYWYNHVPAIKYLWELEVQTIGKSSYYITNNIEFFKPA